MYQRNLDFQPRLQKEIHTHPAQPIYRNCRIPGFKGWKPHSVVVTAKIVQATSNMVANLIINCKVSAKDLHLLMQGTAMQTPY